ncbi:hypothetical protein ACIBI7_17945 [Nonomuraea fuscirosea]|uniref:hypothetical protein n=1 Tax=Nonomuraea fuscirosea TaxID=1291556 RepID=UPI00378C0033
MDKSTQLGVEAQCESSACLQQVTITIVLIGQQVTHIGLGGQRLVVLGVVSLSGCTGFPVEGGVEVVVGSVLTDAGSHKPVPHLGAGFVGEDGTAPTAGLDLEKDYIIDGSDSLMRGVRGGELLARLLQQRVVDLVECGLGRWDG